MSVRTYSLIHHHCPSSEQQHPITKISEKSNHPHSEEEEEEDGYKDLSSGEEGEYEESPEDLLASVTTVIKIPESRPNEIPPKGGYAALYQQQKRASRSSSSTSSTSTKNDLQPLKDSLISLAAIIKTNLPSYPQRYELQDDSEEECDENEQLQEDELPEEEEQVEEEDDEYNDDEEHHDDDDEETESTMDELENTISTVITNNVMNEEQTYEEHPIPPDELEEIEDKVMDFAKEHVDSETDEAALPLPTILSKSFVKNQSPGASFVKPTSTNSVNFHEVNVASSIPENPLKDSIRIEKSEANVDDGYTDLEADDNQEQNDQPVITSTIQPVSVLSEPTRKSISESSHTPIVDEKLLMKSISLFKQYNAEKVSQSTNGHPLKTKIALSNTKLDEPLRVSKILEIPKPLINLEESISENDVEKIKKQNHLLRMQLLQQERIIEESKKVLQSRIDQEIEKAKSQALKDFISRYLKFLNRDHDITFIKSHYNQEKRAECRNTKKTRCLTRRTKYR